jgi:phospholipid transport system substrate-binding protein|tara:strand:- start:822 stop:1427 length:606 start_codon:yes stop_codon:yes gene_type:complete
MRQLFTQFSLILLSYLLVAQLVKSETPQLYVEKIHDDIIQVVIEKQSIYEDRPEEFIKSISKSLEPLVDFKRISRNVMGKHYKMASQDQRDKFQEIFKSTLLETYSKTLAEFKNEEIRIIPSINSSNKPNREKVYLEIVTSTKIYPAFYDMYLNKKNQWKLINIVINGVNLGVTFRNQFYSLMKDQENDIDKVIDLWIASF